MVTLNGNGETLWWAQKAVEELIGHGGYIPDTKAQFALRMGWVKRGSGAVDEPDVRLVENICNLTRDLAHDPESWPTGAELLAGYVIAYAPNKGGMTLIDPTSGDVPLAHMAHVLAGDIQKQKSVQTIHRRRQPTWAAAAAAAFSGGDIDLGRALDRGHDEIVKSGMLTDQTANLIYRLLDSRGLLAR
jgi:hypothetical protein